MSDNKQMKNTENNNMENLEQNASLFIEKGEQAFNERVGNAFKSITTPEEKRMWITGYLSGLVDGKKEKVENEQR